MVEWSIYFVFLILAVEHFVHEKCLRCYFTSSFIAPFSVLVIYADQAYLETLWIIK